MENRSVQAFFNGAFDLLRASFTASTEFSSATKGASREDGARDVLTAILPHVVRVESGDLIDTQGRRSGQLDGVVVDHRVPTLRLGRSAAGLILAEGAVAVLEIKSNLPKQWAEVLATFKQAAPVRPRVELMRVSENDSDVRKRIRGRHNEQAENDRAIPFFVVAGVGWKRPAELKRKCIKLAGHAPAAGSSYVMIATLDPPMIASTTTTDPAGDIETITRDKDARGDVLAMVWYSLVRQARRHSKNTHRRLALERYFSGALPPTPTKEVEPVSEMKERPK